MKMIKDPEKRIVLTATLSLMANILYAVGNLYLGFYQRSYWFITAGAKMAKSKIIEINEKIAESVTEGYKKIENTVIEGYTKIEDKFVENYLAKDDETVEEAKKRLKGE